MINVKVILKTQPMGQDIVCVIRKAVFDDDNCIEAKYGLSIITGQWIQVPEGDAYPDECLLRIPWLDEKLLEQIIVAESKKGGGT